MRLLAVCVLTTVAVGAWAASATGATKRCGAIARNGEAGLELVAVKADGVGCRTARRVLERHTVGKRTSGWTCHSAGSEAECTDDGASVRYGPTTYRKCASVVFDEIGDDGAFELRSRGVSCRVARAVARASRAFQPPEAKSYDTRRFHCRPRQLPNSNGVLYTCRRPGATVAFERT